MSALLERARRGEGLADLEIIDVHGHLGRYQYAIGDLSPQGLVAVMDRLGVKTILLAHMNCMQGDYAGGNDQVLEAMRAFPGRIEGYVVLWPESPQAVHAQTAARLAQGFVGVKLHNLNGIAYTDPAYAPALAMANERRLPVLCHTWGNDEETNQFGRLAADYPDVSLILAHAGAANLDWYLRLARDLEQVYLDPCMSWAPRGLYETLVAQAGAGKVLWGSDAYFLNMAQQLGRVLGAEISDQDRQAILSGNARRLLARIRR
jgi:hypothetical protein